MITYERAGKTWVFGPLPVSRNTAAIFTALAKLQDAVVEDAFDIGTISGLITPLPEAIERSMRDSHTEQQINAFIDSIELDFGNPDSLGVLGDLSLLFMGIDPTTAPKVDPKLAAKAKASSKK